METQLANDVVEAAHSARSRSGGTGPAAPSPPPAAVAPAKSNVTSSSSSLLLANRKRPRAAAAADIADTFVDDEVRVGDGAAGDAVAPTKRLRQQHDQIEGRDDDTKVKVVVEKESDDDQGGPYVDVLSLTRPLRWPRHHALPTVPRILARSIMIPRPIAGEVEAEEVKRLAVRRNLFYIQQLLVACLKKIIIVLSFSLIIHPPFMIYVHIFGWILLCDEGQTNEVLLGFRRVCWRKLCITWTRDWCA